MSASRCTSVELSLSVVAYFFSNKIENDKLKEPGFPPQKCYICITFSNMRTVISDCDLPTEKNLNQVIHFYYSASIFHSRKSKKFLLSRTIARDIDSLMDYKCRH